MAKRLPIPTHLAKYPWYVEHLAWLKEMGEDVEYDLPDGDARPLQADLAGADLSGLNLTAANLSESDLSGADLSGTNLYRTNLSCADLSGANLTGANLSSAYCFGLKLQGAILSGLILTEDLRGADGLAGGRLVKTLAGLRFVPK